MEREAAAIGVGLRMRFGGMVRTVEGEEHLISEVTEVRTEALLTTDRP